MATSASGARRPAKKAPGTRSGNPAVRASAARAADEAAATPAGPTSAGAWRARSVLEDLALPSGNVCRVKRVGPEVLLQQGILGDSLGTIVAEAISKNQGKKQVGTDELMAFIKDGESIKELIEAVDRICVQVVVEPRLLLHLNENGEAIPDGEREPQDAAIYTDEVDIDDKMHIFQFVVGGTRDWERFRSESNALVGVVDPVAASPRPTKRTAPRA